MPQKNESGSLPYECVLGKQVAEILQEMVEYHNMTSREIIRRSVLASYKRMKARVEREEAER